MKKNHITKYAELRNNQRTNSKNAIYNFKYTDEVYNILLNIMAV